MTQRLSEELPRRESLNNASNESTKERTALPTTNAKKSGGEEEEEENKVEHATSEKGCCTAEHLRNHCFIDRGEINTFLARVTMKFKRQE